MSYDSHHNLGYRLSKELSYDLKTNIPAIFEILKDLLRTCQGQIIDSNRILNSVIQLTQVKDIRVKKLVYLYLSFVTEPNSDIWLHITNSIANDLVDPSSFVRKAAIMILTDSHSVSDSLTDVRIANVAKSLKDSNPSVRRCAVVGVAKLYKLFTKYNIEADLSKVLQDLSQMIYLDDDPSVIVECLRCLQNCGKTVVKTELLISLLERMDMVEEWTKAEIVSLFAEFSNPSKMSHEEIFLVLNLLDPYLDKKYATYLSLSCISAMLHASKRFPSTYKDVKSRIVDFLISQLCIAPQHQLGLILSVLNSIISESSIRKLYPMYKRFLPLQSDDTFVKLLKLKILNKLCTKDTADLILKHVCGFIMTTKETELVSSAFDTLAVVHNHAPTECESFLQAAVNHDKEAIVDSAVLTFWRLLQNTQENSNINTGILINDLLKVFDKLSSLNSKGAYFWIVSRFLNPEHANRFSQILKSEIEFWASVSDTSYKLMLLRVALASYFVAPNIFQKLLGKIFNLALHDSCLVLNRQACMYYGMLKRDIESTKIFITGIIKHADSHCESESNLFSDNVTDSLKGLCLLSLSSNI